MLEDALKTGVDDSQKHLATSGEKPVVIFVPGWGSPKQGFEWELSPMKHKLDECGFETVKFDAWQNGLCEIEINRDRLCLLASEYIRDGREVYYIGHSLGGLIAKEAQDLVDINGLITIGTPHKGTATAQLASGWLSKSAAQMKIGSQYVKANMEQPSMCPMVCIACRFDILIVPPQNAVHPHADHVEWVNHTHLSVMFSRKVANIVVNYLKAWTKA